MQEAPDLARRLSELQDQIDQLSLSLHQWRQTQDHSQPMEQRLSQLTQQCAEIVKRWTVIDQRHVQAVGELETRLMDWSAMETRFQQDAYQRIREFEQKIEHEWETLRQIHEEPVKQLREQAESLSETSAAIAGSAVNGLERAEARLSMLEANLHRHMSQLSHDLQAAVAQLRAGDERNLASLTAGAAPWPLESVVRLHDELREVGPDKDNRLGVGQGQPAHNALALAKTAPLPTETAALLTERMGRLERAITSGKEEVTEAAARAERMRRLWRVSLVAMVVSVAGVSAAAFYLQRRAETRLNEAAARVATAERHAEVATELANERIESIRTDAARQIAEAQQSASNAQIISNVLVASDLVRYNLTGGEATPRARAQVLWSRSRGLVFSGSRVPATPPDATYQIWLLTNAEPVSAGLLTPDSTGRVTLATDDPPNVPRPVTGVAVTLEPTGGRPFPSGTIVLARAPQPVASP